MDAFTLALAKKYTDETVQGGGAIAGKNCVVDKIESISGGKRVTFKWTLDNGTVKTGTMDVMDGANGAKGDKGDKGDTGLTGEKGDTGAQGVQGIQGVKGDKGDKGDTGNTGASGANGEKGDAATVTVGTVQSGASPAVTNSGTTSNAVLNFTLPKGDKGDKGDKGENGLDGKSFEIKAKYADVASLVAEHPTGTAGEAYLVGDNDNPDLYIWLTEDAEWFNNGKIAGVKGDKGDTGDDGYSPSASVSKSGDTVTITIQDKLGQTTATVRDGQNGSDGTDGKSAYEIAVDEGFVGTESEWLASLVGEKGADGEKGEQGIQGIQGLKGEQGIQGVKGDAGFSPIANVTESGGVYTIHIEDENGTTEEEINMSGYASASDVTSIAEKIPSNASSSNKLAAKSDIVIKHNYSMAGTASLEDDIKTFVTALIALGANTYAGFFNRGGNLGTAGNYSITVYAEEGTSTFASGYIALGAGAMGKTQYEVSYYKPTGSSEEWAIKKLVTESENNFKYQVCVTDSDLNNIKTSGAYSIYISDATSQATNHAPTYGWLQLVVIQMNNSQAFCNQILYSADGKMFMRECGNNNWSAWKQIGNDLTSGTFTIPAQTLENGANAEIQIPLVPNDFYCGRIDFGGLPAYNMSLSYNDFSGTFQDTRSTDLRTQYVLYPIGKANLATLHVYLTNYTGSPVTITDVIVTYYLEHHKAQ